MRISRILYVLIPVVFCCLSVSVSAYDAGRDNLRLLRLLLASSAVVKSDPVYTTEDINKLKDEAASGDVAAMRKLGTVYSDEGSEHFDINAALTYLTDAVALKDAAAAAVLGSIYADGTGIEKDPVTAEKFLSYAAAGNDPYGMYRYGMLLLDEKLWENNENTERIALNMIRKSAEIGFAPAQYRMGVFYSGGHHVSMDYGMAFKMFMAAALQDHPDALSSLGYMFVMGIGASANHEVAYMLFSRACLLGNSEGCKMKARFERASRHYGTDNKNDQKQDKPDFPYKYKSNNVNEQKKNDDTKNSSSAAAESNGMLNIIR